MDLSQSPTGLPRRRFLLQAAATAGLAAQGLVVPKVWAAESPQTDWFHQAGWGVITWDVPIQKSGLIPEPFVVRLRSIGRARTISSEGTFTRWIRARSQVAAGAGGRPIRKASC